MERSVSGGVAKLRKCGGAAAFFFVGFMFISYGFVYLW